MHLELSSLQTTSLTLLLTVIGLYGIFAKLGHRSYLSLVPFINLARLGDLIDMPVMGVISALFGILDFGRMCINVYTDKMGDGVLIVFCLDLAVYFLNILFRTILLNGLRKIFGKKWTWVIPLLFVPGVVLAYWGYSKKIQV